MAAGQVLDQGMLTVCIMLLLDSKLKGYNRHVIDLLEYCLVLTIELQEEQGVYTDHLCKTKLASKLAF